MGVILNDDFEGGEFQIVKYDHLKLEMENEWKDYPSPESKIATVESSKGSVIVFPSDVYHRVKPVTKGIRYSLVAWFLGPPFI
jgi:PKHD-type hydroxylase